MQDHNLQPARQGNTYPGARFTLPTNSIYSLVGALIEMKIRLSPDSAVRDFLTTENTRLSITGDYTFEIPAQIIDIPHALYQYDIKITFADLREKTYIGGYWKIEPVITD